VKIYDQQLRALAPLVPTAKLVAYLGPLNAALTEFGINTPARVIAFMAQILHESGRLRYLEEIASGEAYDMSVNPRLAKTLGNTELGDGPRFKGRGVIQLTGRANYKAAGKALGLDLVKNPEKVAEPSLAFRVAGWYWSKHGLNEVADTGDFDRITRTINGGLNGKADRDALFVLCSKVLNR
jgi:putative chitinase